MPEAKVGERTALQQWIDGAPETADPPQLSRLLDLLDVRAVCGTGDRSAVLGGGWHEAGSVGAVVCWLRD